MVFKFLRFERKIVTYTKISRAIKLTSESFVDSRLLVYFLKSDRSPARVIAGNPSLHRPAGR